jgi:hypothetical protein
MYEFVIFVGAKFFMIRVRNPWFQMWIWGMAIVR